MLLDFKLKFSENIFMTSHSFTVKEALSYGWETFKKEWRFLVAVFGIAFLASMVPSMLRDWAQENAPQMRFIFSIIGWVVQMITNIGLFIISLKIVDGKKPKIADLYKHYNLLLNYFLGSLIYGAVLIGGLILLIIPGIIWGIKYQYTTNLIIDKKMSPLDAFKKSGKITEGRKMKLFYLGLAFMGLSLLGLITFGLGLFITWPIISLSGAYVYRKLSPAE